MTKQALTVTVTSGTTLTTVCRSVG